MVVYDCTSETSFNSCQKWLERVRQQKPEVHIPGILQSSPTEKYKYFSYFAMKTYYRIRPNYRTYSYKRTVKLFHSLQIIASVLFAYFFIKAYVVGTHLNCIDLSMQFKWVPTTYVLIKKIRKKKKSHKHQIRPLLIFVFKGILSKKSHILKNLSALCGN